MSCLIQAWLILVFSKLANYQPNYQAASYFLNNIFNKRGNTIIVIQSSEDLNKLFRCKYCYKYCYCYKHKFQLPLGHSSILTDYGMCKLDGFARTSLVCDADNVLANQTKAKLSSLLLGLQSRVLCNCEVGCIRADGNDRWENFWREVFQSLHHNLDFYHMENMKNALDYLLSL